MVCQPHRLRALQMSVAGHQKIEVCLGLVDEDLEEGVDVGHGRMASLSRPKPHVRRHLVVSAPSRVETATDFTDGFDQGGLDVHVDVFLGGIPLELTSLDGGANALEPSHDSIRVLA